MSIFGRRRLTRRQSEQLLAGQGGTPDALAVLLADARRVPPRGEQAGEQAALTAFREAMAQTSAVDHGRTPVRTITLGRMIAVKALAVGAATATLGGVAFAASTGNLPGPLHKSHPATSASASHRAGDQDKDRDKRTPSTHPTGTPSLRPSDPDGAKDHDRLSLIGVCRAWEMVAKNSPATLTKAKPFVDLAQAAGGAAKVPAYCQSQLAQWCQAKPFHRPDTPVKVLDRWSMVRCPLPGASGSGSAFPTPSWPQNGRPTPHGSRSPMPPVMLPGGGALSTGGAKQPLVH